MSKAAEKISLLIVNELNVFLGGNLQSTSEQIKKNLTLSVPEAITESLKNPFAEAYFICLNDNVIGYTAVVFDETIPEHDKHNWLWQFMIDKNYQGHGYASKALMLIIEHMFNNATEKIITLSTKPDNEIAIKLYKKFGFFETGEKNGDEVILQKYNNIIK